MNPIQEGLLMETRRQFLGRGSKALGSLALGALLQPAQASPFPQWAPKAKRVIYLFMGGGPSQFEMFDNKPLMKKMHGKELPKSIIGETRLTGMSGNQSSLPIAASPYKFSKHGQCGMEVSSLFPNVAGCVDDIAMIRSMHTSHSNHYNATLGMHTGSFAFARPSLGSWVSYGLGTMNQNLPSFVVIAPKQTYAGTQVYASDFLPGAHQGTVVVPGATLCITQRGNGRYCDARRR